MTLRRLSLDKLLAEAPEGHQHLAREEVAKALARGPAVIPGLPYTEHDYQLTLLRLHSGHGNIRPSHLRRMRDRDLEYLAGMTQLNERQAAMSDSDYRQEVKVVENAVRATRELQRRFHVRAAWVATLIAALLGATASIVAAIVSST